MSILATNFPLERGVTENTLIKKLIKEAFAGEQIVLIENEFGEIGIDGGFMREAGIQVNELNSGCICCSLVGDFREALKKVVETYHPDRILIEPSGVGKLSDVTRAVESVAEDLPVILNSFVTVADVNKVKMYMKNFGEFYDDQVSHASCIILSRTGNASEEKVAAAVALLAEKNPTATIVTTDWTVLTGAQIVSVMDGKRDLVAELLTEARAANVAHADEDEHEHHHEHGEHCCCGHHHDDDDDEHEHHHHEGCCHHDHEEHDHHHDHGGSHSHAPSTPPDKTEGLEHLIAVAQEAFVALKPGGLLLMEHGYAQGAAIKVLLESHKWENVLILKDLSGHDRVASARKPAA